jgi:hypothetical protein
MLDREFKYFLAHQKELFTQYPNRFLVIVGEEVKGDYESFEAALSAATAVYELGAFLIQECTAGTEAYTQTFHSRVVFC